MARPSSCRRCCSCIGDVLGRKVGQLERLLWARKPRRLPAVLTREEVERVLSRTSGTKQLVAWLLYGSGMRLMEALELRVKDVDFGMRQITVRGGKGDRDRVTMLPVSVVGDLERHLLWVRRVHAKDVKRGAGRVALPGAMDRKYPSAVLNRGGRGVVSPMDRLRRPNPPSKHDLR